MNERNLTHCFIVGFPRCGTTSLFRYLSAHPAVLPSKVKELNFFIEHKEAMDLEEKEYMRYFPPRVSGKTVTVEASPSYSYYYEDAISSLFLLFSQAKIIFLLRDPVDRFISVVSKKGEVDDTVFKTVDSLLQDGSILQYAPPRAPQQKDSLEFQLHYQLWLGKYIHVLQRYAEIFSKGQNLPLFTENLRAFPRQTMGTVCDFLSLSSETYDDFVFSIENPSVQPRWPILYRRLLKLNRQMEPILNRVPFVRQWGRSLHHTLNTVPKTSQDYAIGHHKERLRIFYQQEIRDLKKFLLQEYDHLYTQDTLPDWVKSS